MAILSKKFSITKHKILVKDMYFQLVIKIFRRKLHFIIKECLENSLYFRPSQWLPPLRRNEWDATDSVRRCHVLRQIGCPFLSCVSPIGSVKTAQPLHLYTSYVPIPRHIDESFQPLSAILTTIQYYVPSSVEIMRRLKSLFCCFQIYSTSTYSISTIYFIALLIIYSVKLILFCDYLESLVFRSKFFKFKTHFFRI